MLILSISQSISNVFASVFHDNVILATILISLLPIIELRGAIPFAMEKAVWGPHALSNWQAFGWAFLGSSLVVPFVALAFIPIMNWLKRTKWFRSIGEAIENKVKKHSDKMLENKTSENVKKTYWLKMLGVFAFVAVPLPLTGVWTGTAIAVMIGLNFWSACASIILGNLTAGLLITLLSSLFNNASTIILLAFLAIIALMILYALIKWLIKKYIKNNSQSNADTTSEQKIDNKENENNIEK